MTRLIVLAAFLALPACGSVQQLKAAADAPPPPKASAARTPATPEQLLTADTQARPTRTDESLRKSDKRKPDPFDLPPTN